MRERRWLWLINIIGFAALVIWVQSSSAQTSVPPTTTSNPVKCNLLHDLVPANPADPTSIDSTKLTTLDPARKKFLLTSGLPCAETVSGSGPAKSGLENRQRGFDFYSWLTFIALNSPAKGDSIDQSKSDTKTMWEDRNNFMHLLDVMVEDPEHNTPRWGQRKVPQECRNKYQGLIKNIDDMMVIEMIEETFNEPFKTGPLIDQQGNYALFDILMNKNMFQFIVDNKFYSKKVQRENRTLKVDFLSGFNPDKGKTDGGDPGAMMIKVSWKVIESEKDKQRFHTVDALVLMPRHEDKSEPPPPCLRKTLGLVGFHVGHKTVNRRQWIWTSFEHVANVPEDQEVASGNLTPPYNFYRKCAIAECPVNQTPPHPWDPTYANGLKFHDSTFKSQITRVVPLTDEAKEMNKQFQRILGDTVWKNYMLLSTQWPSDFECSTRGDPSVDVKVTPPNKQPTDFNKQFDMTCAPAPTYLANSTLETYSQGKSPLASSSCIACHGNAVSHQRRSADGKPGDVTPADVNFGSFYNQSDFTFMLEKAR
jgi:hypothetical protein